MFTVDMSHAVDSGCLTLPPELAVARQWISIYPEGLTPRQIRIVHAYLDVLVEFASGIREKNAFACSWWERTEDFNAPYPVQTADVVAYTGGHGWYSECPLPASPTNLDVWRAVSDCIIASGDDRMMVVDAVTHDVATRQLHIHTSTC